VNSRDAEFWPVISGEFGQILLAMQHERLCVGKLGRTLHPTGVLVSAAPQPHMCNQVIRERTRDTCR
jgi:hypothetical protein